MGLYGDGEGVQRGVGLNAASLAAPLNYQASASRFITETLLSHSFPGFGEGWDFDFRPNKGAARAFSDGTYPNGRGRRNRR